MSTEQSSRAHEARSVADTQHQPQSAQWREIGISAVAAAAQQASAQRTANATQDAAAPKKVVTLRDIDHLAA